MKILTVCGMGLGTGLLLRMNVEKALRTLGVDDFQVEVADIGMARGAGTQADLIVTSNELAPQLGQVRGKVVTVTNLVDLKEVTEKLRSALNLSRA
jgi:PTS system ascorbate-specific IIB component